ncbi:MAG: PIN domain-containing protein [Pirellulaceae bacterium]|nr:PIN domain-containing protein [Pirellulaceae bacterium]
MRTVFADTFYWIALANPRDEWHAAARNAGRSLGAVHIITTDEVLVEFLAFFAPREARWRGIAVELVRKIMDNPNVTVIPQTRDSFKAGLRLYESRLDKQYSLTDCVSMQTMRQQGLQDVLTHDHHFEQEGLSVLLKDKSL